MTSVSGRRLNTRRISSRVLAAIICLAGFLFLGALPSRRPPRFSHKLHIEQGVDCKACHPRIEESTKTADNNLPGMQTECGTCHSEWLEDEKRGCTYCHYDPIDKASEAPYQTSPANYKFDHRKHVVGAKTPCQTCHQNVATTDYGQTVSVPARMDFCTTCHDGKRAPGACATCHAVVPRPRSHDATWKRNHGLSARVDDHSCRSCHPSDDFCTKCHRAGNERPLSHDRNFIYNHWQVAEGKEEACSTCHDNRSFCVACHISRPGTMPRSHLNPGWVPSMHMAEAEQDLERCAVCHDTKSPTCVRCHGEGD